MTDRIPRVAIPARLSSDESVDVRVAAANRIFGDVVELIRSNGLAPVVVSEKVDLTDFDGVVLPGGGDIDPLLYGGEESDALYDVNPEQDALDLALARAAINTRTPILGICRGAQVLNVAAGGTLYADLPQTAVTHSRTLAPGEEPSFGWHTVAVTKSRLRNALGRESASVATGHHQGIATLASGLIATATAEDDLVEAFENESGTVIGVQWHPEAAGTPRADQDAPFQLLAAAITAREATNV